MIDAVSCAGGSGSSGVRAPADVRDMLTEPPDGAVEPRDLTL